jgi:hypothetical protein
MPDEIAVETNLEVFIVVKDPDGNIIYEGPAQDGRNN